MEPNLASTSCANLAAFIGVLGSFASFLGVLGSFEVFKKVLAGFLRVF